jgi:hypothetical protein
MSALNCRKYEVEAEHRTMPENSQLKLILSVMWNNLGLIMDTDYAGIIGTLQLQQNYVWMSLSLFGK